MRILLCNDDGYRAPGISKLAQELSTFAEVCVVAPDGNRSASSSSLSLGKPIYLYRDERGFMYTTGTPADCVQIAVTGVLPWRPDLIVAGINDVANLGDDTIYSGTVAIATEGFLFDIPAIAFSQVDRGWTHLDDAVKVAADIVQKMSKHLKKPFLLNVNIPNLPLSEIKGYQATRLGRRYGAAPVERQVGLRQADVFRIGPCGEIIDAKEGTDFYAVHHGYVSVTPLQIDWTDYQGLQALNDLFAKS